MAGAKAATEVARASVVAYRLTAQSVAEPVRGWPAVLAVGVQDTPPGATAPQALRLRSARTADPYGDPEVALVHGARGAMHLHRAGDLPALAAALRPDGTADLLRHTHGPFFDERAAEGLPAGELFDTVAAAMAEVMADGRERTKGELSGAVTPRVPGPVAPWCGGCGVHHVHDGLFRMASLQAGLRLRPVGDGSAVFLPPDAAWPGGGERPATEASRRSLVRDFLRYAGPAGPDSLAAWLGLAPPAARRWWSLLGDEVVRVSVDGRQLWAHRDDLAAVAGTAPAAGVLLLPPYDPLLEIADRALLVPDAALRRRVWQAAANPGVLLVDGEVAGVWRRRRAGKRLTVTVTAFEPLPRRRRGAVTEATERLLAPAVPEVLIEE